MLEPTDEILDQKAIANFRTYLQFATVHPDPDYYPAVEWLRSQAEELGLISTLTEIVPNNPILVICWKGRMPELPAILLNSHMDVVPVDESKWDYPPFAAKISSDGKIYARGSQDMKCVGIQQLEAVRRLKSQGINQLKRTVYLSFVPDEEVGGGRGMRAFVQGIQPDSCDCPQEIRFSDMNIGLCLDEGIPSPWDQYLAFYDERHQCGFTAHFSGVAGHGSVLMEGTAGEKLQGFLNRITTFRAEEMNRMNQLGGLSYLSDVTTVNLTMLKGGVQHNVLPSILTAQFDVRLHPSHTKKTWQKQLQQWADEVGGGIEFEFSDYNFENWEAVPCPDEANDPIWSTLRSVCRDFGADLIAKVFPGATDARFVRQYHTLSTTPPGTKPIQAIGFTPLRCTPILLHDHNECLSVEEFLRGCQLYAKLLGALGELT